MANDDQRNVHPIVIDHDAVKSKSGIAVQW